MLVLPYPFLVFRWYVAEARFSPFMHANFLGGERWLDPQNRAVHGKHYKFEVTQVRCVGCSCTAAALVTVIPASLVAVAASGLKPTSSCAIDAPRYYARLARMVAYNQQFPFAGANELLRTSPCSAKR